MSALAISPFDALDALAASPKDRWGVCVQWFCADCLAPYGFSYRALGASCEAQCGNVNDGSGKRHWIARDELQSIVEAARSRPLPSPPSPEGT